MKLGTAPTPNTLPHSAANEESPPRSGPGPRMSAMLVVHRSVLYVYGGVLEKDEKQFYLGDMYSLDLHKLNEWKTMIRQTALPDWVGSDSESESDGSDSETESDESD